MDWRSRDAAIAINGQHADCGRRWRFRIAGRCSWGQSVALARPAASSAPAPRVGWPVAKRTLDLGLSLVLLLVALPLLVLIAVAIKLDSPGPVFYRVRRVGYRAQPLLMLKFRKMHHDARGGPLTAPDDPRLTTVGAFLTRWRLDELPQLWNVVRGEMSLIGPRPEDPAFVALHRDDYEQILAVRPGMTGLSQIAYKEESRIVDGRRLVEDYVTRILPQKLTMDKLYASILGPRLDLAIVFWTLVTMLLRRPVSVNRRTGGMNLRRRPSPHGAVRGLDGAGATQVAVLPGPLVAAPVPEPVEATAT